MDSPVEQLELFGQSEDDGSWAAWFLALPLVPPDRPWARPVVVEEQLTFERAA
jgi:hypothetical protein